MEHETNGLVLIFLGKASACRQDGSLRLLSAAARPTVYKIGNSPVEVITDKAAVYPRVLEKLAPGAWHHTEQYANNRIETDHGRLKSRLRPMRGLKQLRCARVITTRHAFVQNIRRGHYELGIEEPTTLRVVTAFTELIQAI